MSTTQTGKHIGYTLVDQEIITEEQLEDAMALLQKEPESSNRRLGQILYQELDLEQNPIMKGIADTYAIREVFEGEEKVDSSEIERIGIIMRDLPQEVIDELVHHKAIPIDKDRDSLTVAAADPTDPVVIRLIESLSFRNYELVYCRHALLEDILEQVYERKNEFLDLLEDIEYDTPDLEQAEEDNKINEEQIDAEINQSMLNSLVEGMLVEAVRKGVSDIHVVPSGPTTTDIRFRVDGKLDLWHQQKNVKPEAISAVVKDKTRDVDRFERDASQDGFIQRQVDNHSIRYRVSIMPMVGKEFQRKFESVVIRVLDDRKVITDLNVLGLQEKAKGDFVKAIEKPSGIVIITGPTGSGKSTTLVAALYYVIDPSVNVLTVEEPVEYLIEGARQLKLSNHMTFDQAMRGILRHDPDIVLVGEIRDLKTAEIAIKLANTGHLTFSTLHTNDAPSAVSRLYKMGVEPFLIANAVNLIMAQRLVRKLCDNCKEEYEPHEQMAKGIGFSDEEIEDTTFYKAVGCDECTKGYKGRTAIMEALYFDAQIRKLILESGTEIDEAKIKQYAVSQGMLSLRASGRERIKNGITTIDEVAAITIEDENGDQQPIADQPAVNNSREQQGGDFTNDLSEDKLRKLIATMIVENQIKMGSGSTETEQLADKFPSSDNGVQTNKNGQDTEKPPEEGVDEHQEMLEGAGDIEDDKKEHIRYFLENPPAILKNFHDDDILEFMKCGSLEQYTADNVIISNEDYVKSGYLLVGGEVAVWKENIQLANLNKGAFIGETFLFSKNTRMPKVVSVSDSTLLRFDRHIILGFFRNKPKKLFDIFNRNINEMQQHKMGTMNDQLFNLKKRLLNENK